MSAEQAALQADVVVVGMAVGGEAVAGQLADAGLDVVGTEAELVGGECPYWACIPSTMMLRAAHLLADARRVPGMAGDIGDVTPDWASEAERIRREATDDWDDTVAVDRFTDKGGRFPRGRARILDPTRVEVPRQRHHRGPARHRARHGHHAPRNRPWRAWRTRRTGPTARRSPPNSCRAA